MKNNRFWATVLAVPLIATGCAVPGVDQTGSSAGRAQRVKAESDHTVAAKVSFAAEDPGSSADGSAVATTGADQPADAAPADGVFVELPGWPDSAVAAGDDGAMGAADDGAKAPGSGGAQSAPSGDGTPWWRRAKDVGNAWVPPSFVRPSPTVPPTSTPVPSLTPWPTATTPPTATPDTLAAAGDPVRLEIPAIGVDAMVEHVGLTTERAMDVPKDWMNVGWYENGPLPGAVGNAVIAGHLDTNTGGPAVFWMLNRLAPGDQVAVTYANGDRYVFIVQELVEYDHDAEGEVIDTVFGESLAPSLNLVTCQGVWDYGNGTYNKRLVVFTALAPELTVHAASGLIRD